MEWQLIETAPKDGSFIDLWVNGERVADCCWQYRLGGGCFAYWGQDAFESPGYVRVTGNITHWRPLPAPPAT